MLRSWGSHDAIVLLLPRDQLAVGDAVSPFARINTLDFWEEGMLSGRAEVRVFRPIHATPQDGMTAAWWWQTHVLARPYDWGAFPRLLIKALLMDLIDTVAGWEWAWYCTEGVHAAWKHGPQLEIYGKTNPTPLTTEHRAAGPGQTLMEITEQAIVPYRKLGEHRWPPPP